MRELGTIIDDRYELLSEVGRGGMSVVYLGLDKRLIRPVAVKEISKTSNNITLICSIRFEVELLKKVDFKGVPRIYDVIDTEESFCIVMEYIEGKTLDRILNEEGAQPEERVVQWGKQLCEILSYLHSCNPPIIYRDVKPANIMLTPKGDLYLIDFGIAREYKEGALADETCLGTRGYAAPEQFGGMGQTDQRTDVYALGVTLYYLVTGNDPIKAPYEIISIREWNPALSRGFEKIIIKCTEPNPNDRYQSCAEVMVDLECKDKLGKQRINFSSYIEHFKLSRKYKQKYCTTKPTNDASVSLEEIEYFARIVGQIYKEERVSITEGIK